MNDITKRRDAAALQLRDDRQALQLDAAVKTRFSERGRRWRKSRQRSGGCFSLRGCQCHRCNTATAKSMPNCACFCRRQDCFGLGHGAKPFVPSSEHQSCRFLTHCCCTVFLLLTWTFTTNHCTSTPDRLHQTGVVIVNRHHADIPSYRQTCMCPSLRFENKEDSVTILSHGGLNDTGLE